MKQCQRRDESDAPQPPKKDKHWTLSAVHSICLNHLTGEWQSDTRSAQHKISTEVPDVSLFPLTSRPKEIVWRLT